MKQDAIRRCAGCFAVVVAAVAVSAPVSLASSGNASVRSANLLRNGGAEAGIGVADDTGVVATVPGWAKTGAFTVVKYGASGGFPDATVSKAVKGGKNFFAGGPANPNSGMTQDVSVARFATAIDKGRRTVTLSGALGGFSGQRDALTVVATFRNASGATLGSIRIGPVTPAARKGATTLLARTATAKVPARTRVIHVDVQAVRTDGAYNDGYADNLSLTLGP